MTDAEESTSTESKSSIDNFKDCLKATEQFISNLAEQDWSVQSLCPDWDIRGVIGHLAGLENALRGWRAQGPDKLPPFTKMQEFLDETANLPNSEFLEKVRAVFSARETELDELTDDDYEAITNSPVGPVSYRRFLDVRVFDFWVHLRDMAIPLGITTDDAGPTAESAMDLVQNSIGFIVGKRIGLPDQMSIRFEISGPLQRNIDVAVDGRAKEVESLDDPDVVIKTDFITFMLLVCGRIDPQTAIDDGRISWVGDEQWGQRAAKSLRFLDI